MWRVASGGERLKENGTGETGLGRRLTSKCTRQLQTSKRTTNRSGRLNKIGNRLNILLYCTTNDVRYLEIKMLKG